MNPYVIKNKRSYYYGGCPLRKSNWGTKKEYAKIYRDEEILVNDLEIIWKQFSYQEWNTDKLIGEPIKSEE